jgi:hypothetical protein
MKRSDSSCSAPDPVRVGRSLVSGRYGALVVAVAATGTALCVSVLSGWQRGGWLTERLVWIAIGVVLVSSAHLLPALCRTAPIAVRFAGTVLWLACMVTAGYGHATFLLLSQSHAGILRAESIPAHNPRSHRSLTAVMAERASVTSELAIADARQCPRDCPSLRARRAGLSARLDALDAEVSEVRRLQAIEDGNAARRDAARDDPVMVRLAALCGVAAPKLDLLAGLIFAAVLESVACLLWWIALQPLPDCNPAVAGSEICEPVTPDLAGSSLATAPETELARLTRDIGAGLVHPTVSGIRRHLHCSQARALALRRQLTQTTS